MGITYYCIWRIFITNLARNWSQGLKIINTNNRYHSSNSGCSWDDRPPTLIDCCFFVRKGGLDNWPFVGLEWGYLMKRSWSIWNTYQVSCKLVEAFKTEFITSYIHAFPTRPCRDCIYNKCSFYHLWWSPRNSMGKKRHLNHLNQRVSYTYVDI